MIRTLMRVALAGACAIALALAGWSVSRPRVMLRQVGLSGWRGESGRRCDNPVGTRWRHCYGAARAGDPAREETRVTLDRRTGRFVDLERVWYVRDSAGMLQQEDSVARAVARLGGVAIECPAPAAPEGGAQRIAAWRFHEQDVRMIRSRWRVPRSPRPMWMFQVSGFPIGYSGCGGAVRRRRLLTPAEWFAAMQRWLVEHTD